MTRALFDVAQRDFERAVRLDGSLKDRIPDVEQFKPFTQLFRGLNRRGAPGSETSVHWKFSADRPQEARDFKPLHQMMKVELTGGQLKVSSPPMFLVTAAGVQGAWSNSARITAVPASNNPPPLIAVQSQGGAFAVILGQKTQLFNGFTGDGEALAESEIRAMPGTQVELACQVHGEKATLVVKLDGQEVFSHEVPFQGEIKFNVGAKGSGEARFDEIKVAGVLSEPWAQRTLAAAPNLIARQLREMNRQRTAQTGKAPVIPVAYTETSAEDEVALEGIPADLVKMLKDGRTLLEQGNEYRHREVPRGGRAEHRVPRGQLPLRVDPDPQRSAGRADPPQAVREGRRGLLRGRGRRGGGPVLDGSLRAVPQGARQGARDAPRLRPGPPDGRQPVGRGPEMRGGAR